MRMRRQVAEVRVCFSPPHYPKRFAVLVILRHSSKLFPHYLFRTWTINPSREKKNNKNQNQTTNWRKSIWNPSHFFFLISKELLGQLSSTSLDLSLWYGPVVKEMIFATGTALFISRLSEFGQVTSLSS